MPKIQHTPNTQERQTKNPNARPEGKRPGEQSPMPTSLPSASPQPQRLHDARLPIPLRQRMAQRIGKIAGNRSLQRLTAVDQPAPVQRGLWDDFVTWFSGLFSTDPQDVIENMDSGLEHAHTVATAVAETTTDPALRRRWEQLAERLDGLKSVTGGIVDVIEAAETINHIEDFVEALNDIPDNISDDPDAAADAFGRLFASAGELGGLLPEGPWSPYFTWLAESRDFFTNMRHALDPGLRWRREFEEIEREAGGATERGLGRR
jgi:hypothetical protein